MIEKILEYITKRCIYIRMKLQTCVGYSQAEKNIRLEELYTIKQECERMRKYHNKCCEEFEKEKKEWLEKYNQVSRDFCSGKYCNAEKCQQLNQLKAENDNLKSLIWWIHVGAEGADKATTEYYENRNTPYEENYWKRIRALQPPTYESKYKLALTEIKEIAKPHQRNIDKICGHCRRYDGCHACCIDDINCYQHKKPTTPACDKYCELKEFEINNIANQILQKISEVEDAINK